LKYRKEMKGLEWGIFYNKYSEGKYDSKQLEARIVELMENKDDSDKTVILIIMKL